MFILVLTSIIFLSFSSVYAQSIESFLDQKAAEARAFQTSALGMPLSGMGGYGSYQPLSAFEIAALNQQVYELDMAIARDNERMRQANIELLRTYSVDDAMKEFTNSATLAIGLARKSSLPNKADVNLNKSEDFWASVRKNKNREGQISDFYKSIYEKYLQAQSTDTKAHWFFYAVRVSQKDRQLITILRKGEHKKFIETLKLLYLLAKSPDLSYYFDENTTRQLNKSLVINLDTSALEKTTNQLEQEMNSFVVDDQNASKTGTWTSSRGKEQEGKIPIVDVIYIHDGNESKGEKSVTFRKDLSPGMYNVQIAYSSHSNRATDVPVTITHMGGDTTIIVNQQKSPNIDDLFFSLGTYKFGEIGIVTISNAHTNGYVIADAVRFVSEKVEIKPSAQTDSDTVDQAKEDLSNLQTPIGRWQLGEEARWNVTLFADGTGKAGWHDEDVLWNQDADGIVRTIFAKGHRKIQTCKLSNDGRTMTIIASNQIGDTSIGRILYRTAYDGFTSSFESSEQPNKSTSSLVVEQEKENLSSLQTPVGWWNNGNVATSLTFFADGTGKVDSHDEDVLWNQDADGTVRAIVAKGHRKIITYKLDNDGQAMTVIASNYIGDKAVGSILYRKP